MPPTDSRSAASRTHAVLLFLAYIPLILGFLWCVGYCVCRPVLFLPLLLGGGLIIVLKAKWPTIIPLWPSLTALLAVFIALFTLQRAPQEHYAQAYAKAPNITQKDDVLHIRNIRDFEYRTEDDFIARYLEEDFSLNELSAVHYIDAFRRGEQSEHRILLCFDFRDGRSLVITPELRLPATEKQPNAVKSFYKRYGMVYTFGTEEDLLAMRTDHRGDYLSLYTLNATPEQAQQMLLQCANLATETEQNQTPCPPFASEYSGGMQQVLRIVCPDLGNRRNENVVQRLYEKGALRSHKGETWEALHRRASLGHKLAPENRADYADAVRRAAGEPTRSASPAERHVQEIIAPAEKTKSAKRAVQVNMGEMFTAPTAAPETPQTVPASDVPTPRPAAAPTQQQRSDIMEPGERRRQEEMNAYLEEQRIKREKRNAAEGRSNADDESGVDFGKIFLDRKGSGIKIIEKNKKKEAPHPLDPYTRRNLLEEEDEQREQQERERQEHTDESQYAFPADQPKKLNL